MGKPDQVFKFTNFMDHLIGGIRAGTIAAIGTPHKNQKWIYKTKLLLLVQLSATAVKFHASIVQFICTVVTAFTHFDSLITVCYIKCI
jgi:hypothetical protein